MACWAVTVTNGGVLFFTLLELCGEGERSVLTDYDRGQFSVSRGKPGSREF